MFDMELALKNNTEFKFGRVVEADGSVRPFRDTGYRSAGAPAPYVAPPQRQTSLPALEIHADDTRDLGPATIRRTPLESVRAIAVDYDASKRRLLHYTLESITARRRQEEKENADAAKN